MLRLVATVTCACLFVPVGVRADGASEADKLFEEGRVLAKAGNYAEACDKFRQSFLIDHAPGTELNLGDCQEHLGKAREAWESFNAAADEFDRKGEANRAKFARDRADTVGAKLAEVDLLVVDPSIEGLSITIAGRETKPQVTIHDRVEPGKVVVRATAPGLRDFTKTVDAKAGGRAVVSIPKTLGAEADTTTTTTAVTTDDRHHSRVRLALWLGAGAGASAFGALAFALVGRSHWNTAADGPHCSKLSNGDVTCDSIGTTDIHDAQRLADIGTGFAIGAGALLAVSAIVYLTAPPETTVVTPVANGQTVGLAISGRF